MVLESTRDETWNAIRLGMFALMSPVIHVHRGPLGREEEMNARRPGLLGEPGDELLDLLSAYHHQVGELVHHHHDEGHRLGQQTIPAVLARPRPRHRVGNGLAGLHRLRDLAVESARFLTPSSDITR